MNESKPKGRPSKPMVEQIVELRALCVPELVERYEALFGKPPRVKHREWLWRRLAWKVQEQRLGGLSDLAKRRLDELIAELDLPLSKEKTVRYRGSDPLLGTTLTRTWKGQEVRATAVDGGWEHEGVPYRSLSAVVKAVTGSHASGPAWFGLRTRTRK